MQPAFSSQGAVLVAAGASSSPTCQTSSSPGGSRGTLKPHMSSSSSPGGSKGTLKPHMSRSSSPGGSKGTLKPHMLSSSSPGGSKGTLKPCLALIHPALEVQWDLTLHSMAMRFAGCLAMIITYELIC